MSTVVTSRRAALGAAVWSVPTFSVAVSAPAFAASTPSETSPTPEGYRGKVEGFYFPLSPHTTRYRIVITEDPATPAAHRVTKVYIDGWNPAVRVRAGVWLVAAMHNKNAPQSRTVTVSTPSKQYNMPVAFALDNKKWS